MVEPTQPGDVDVRTPSRPLPATLALALGVVATGLILLLTIGVTKPETAATPPVQSAAAPVDAVAPDPAVGAPEDRPRASDLAALDSWARELAAKTNVPANLLAVYGRAEMWLRGESATCHLSWATLAGIGQFEAVGSGPLPVQSGIWDRWAARATHDGKAPDPRNADDAAYTVGRYLCSSGGDLATGGGWWQAVLGYTRSTGDAQSILTATNAVATASR
ncbi:MAG TPA: hypothetical protein VJ870_01655 [Amycolatopsis sp.]|nr:hypothetical protein [Amycolatopsis sp.]